MSIEDKLKDFKDYDKLKDCSKDVHKAFYESLEKQGLYKNQIDFQIQYQQYKNG